MLYWLGVGSYILSITVQDCAVHLKRSPLLNRIKYFIQTKLTRPVLNDTIHLWETIERFELSLFVWPVSWHGGGGFFELNCSHPQGDICQQSKLWALNILGLSWFADVDDEDSTPEPVWHLFHPLVPPRFVVDVAAHCWLNQNSTSGGRIWIGQPF